MRGYRIPNKRKIKVSYYDGSTLLGIRRVSKGKDVLHPSITMPVKTDYTFVGWATSNSEDDWVSTLVADSESITLYAIYLPNSLTVCASHRVNASSATTDTWNSRYMGGSAYVIQESNGQSLTGSATFTITLNRYQNSRTVLWTHWYMIDSDGYGYDRDGSMGVDSDSSQYQNGSVLNDLVGNHTMTVHAFPNWGNGERFVRAFGGLANVTLSNPIAWI